MSQSDPDLLKWKSRCVSLTAEVVALRESIRSRRVGALAKHYERKYWNHANRIRDEREADIKDGVDVVIRTP